nr:hypothetical protein [Tanacetum cinerariifolium]
MRADKFWKKTGKKISIQRSDVAGFDKSKVECFKCHKMGHFARECRALRNQERGRRDTYRHGSKAEEQTSKALMAIDGVETLKQEKEVVDGKLAGLLSASKDLDNLIKSQRSDKSKECLGYTAVPLPVAQLYFSPKKDLSWTGLLECADDTVTDYSRPSLTVESSSEEDQNRNLSAFENGASPITPKQFVKFVKASDSQSKSKTDEKETPEKPLVKNAEQYRKPNQKPNVRGNQRNWNNLKSHQLGPDFVMKKKACFNCDDFNYLAYEYRKRVKRGTTRPSPTVESSSKEDQNRNPSASKNVASPITPKQFVKFIKASDSQSKSKTDEKETLEKPPVKNAEQYRKPNKKPNGSSQNHIDDKRYWDSGCSMHITGNISYLSDYEPFDVGYVSFRQGGCKITGKGTIKTGKLEFENVYFVKDLKYNLFSVSQICNNKNNVLFTDSECVVLGRDFKLLDDANILLRTPRQYNMYSIDLNNIIPHRDLTCLVAKASANECNLWHKRLGKQHKASCKSKLVTSVSKPLHTLHMDLFGPTSVSSISHKWYCLVVTDDFSKFTWTFFLRTKDETSSILRKFITKIENLKDLRVKIIRCDNGGEFRNKELNNFCSQKGIKREFSNAKTPQQNGVAERRNRSLIEAARTMLADAKLPVIFWAEAVNTACYVQNRVLVNKAHNKTPYELFNGRTYSIKGPRGLKKMCIQSS